MVTHKRPSSKRALSVVAAFAAALLVMAIFTATPAATKGNAVTPEDWQSKACQGCHPQEWNAWSRSGHAMTLSAQLLNSSHNSEELLDQTCVKCHSPELGTVKISDLVQPIDQKGPWKLVGQYANLGDLPSIPCLACHQAHAVKQPGLLPGMDFADESTFYRDVTAPEVANLFIYDAFAQKYIDPAPIAPVMNGDQSIPIADTRANRVCYTCHATEQVASNLFEPSKPPEGDNSVSTGDDRTLMGAHQGLPCVTCHMAGGDHSFNPMNACKRCHSPGSTAASLDYVTQVQTSYTDPALSMLSGNMSSLNIHWLDKTQLWPPVAVNMQAMDTGDTVTYNITLRNFGSANVSNIDLRGSIPKGAGYLDSQIVDGNNSGTFDGSDVSFTIGAVPAGQTFGPIIYRVTKGTAKDFTAHAWASWEQPVPGTANSPNVTITK
ncbi:MAG: hypothetical protein KGJ80_05085 [Chloroflexota bacterium]|nr:hypothetical protein [Chloroflexota bacterium]